MGPDGEERPAGLSQQVVGLVAEAEAQVGRFVAGGDPDAALAALEALAVHSPAEVAAVAWHAMGMVLAASGRPGVAGALERAVAGLEGDRRVGAAANLGAVLDGAGDHEGAARAYRQAAGVHRHDGPDLVRVSIPGGQHDRRQAAGLVRAALDGAGGRRVELVATDELVRHAAREAGFSGDLAGPLVLGGGGPAHPAGPGDLAAAVASLVPGTSLAVRAPGPDGTRLLRGLASRGTRGLDRSLELEADLGDGWPPLAVVVPDRDDLLVEAVASALATTRGVRARMGSHVAHVRLIAFDYSDKGLRSGRVAGLAHPLGYVHLNAGLACAGGMEGFRPGIGSRQAVLALALAQPAPASGSPAWIEGTVAHELWHGVENAFEATRYRDSIRFRQELGAYFGVDTLEHAFDDRAGEIDPRRLARERLRAEVSDYAGTGRLEATAELFRIWWCWSGSSSDPPPAAHHFGQLLDRYFPAPG